jgi:hypothetical protein
MIYRVIIKSLTHLFLQYLPSPREHRKDVGGRFKMKDKKILWEPSPQKLHKFEVGNLILRACTFFTLFCGMPNYW